MDLGDSSIDLININISVNSASGDTILTADSVKDFNSTSKHNYYIKIGLEELCEILSKLSLATKNNPVIFESLLQNHLKSLVQLTAIAAGLGDKN